MTRANDRPDTEIAAEIVVGVDGSPESHAAAVWAAHEAAERGVGLAVVHVNDIGSHGLWATSRGVRDELRAMGQSLVDEALALVRERYPELPVRGRVLLGGPVRVMTLLSAHAPLIVVGLRGRDAVSRLLAGSVSQHLMAHAKCPVVATPPGIPETGTRRVVLALDEPANESAETYAFDSARRADVELVGLRAIGHDDPEAPGERLAKEIAGRRRDYPDVDARYVVLPGDPVDVLPAACEPTDLLVVGHHRHGPFSPVRLGPVLTGLVHAARCPVAVVPGTPDRP